MHISGLSFDEVAVERETAEGLRPDVLLLHRGHPVLGIEVLVTHAVGAAKAARTTHPWLELDARQVLAAPSAWKPVGHDHPWTGSCPQCAWADRVCLFEGSEHLDPGVFVLAFSASTFEARIRQWLESGRRTTKPGVCWRCPWCRENQWRPLEREAVLGVHRATSLGPPILPEVILHLASGAQVSITFSFPRNPKCPRAIVPLRPSTIPALRASHDPKRPVRLALNGTNRPMAFLCRRCGRDCLGILPSPSAPLPGWESLDQ
jgi:hypothetical protein